MSERADDSAPFMSADRSLLAAFARHDSVLRALLCTLARRGAALRRDAPARARAWTDALCVHPYYKGGQFLFDLLEWEDFMLDGDPPPLLDDTAIAAALGRVTQVLRAFGAALDGRPVEESAAAAPAAATLDQAAPDWPALAGSAFLYPDAVLGAIDALTVRR